MFANFQITNYFLTSENGNQLRTSFQQDHILKLNYKFLFINMGFTKSFRGLSKDCSSSNYKMLLGKLAKKLEKKAVQVIVSFIIIIFLPKIIQLSK